MGSMTLAAVAALTLGGRGTAAAGSGTGCTDGW